MKVIWKILFLKKMSVLMNQWYLITDIMVATIHPKQTSQIRLQAVGSSHSPWLRYTVLSLCGKDDNYNKDIGLCGSVVMTLMSKFPTVPDLHYHAIIDFFTSPSLLRVLKESVIAATGTVRAKRTEKAPQLMI